MAKLKLLDPTDPRRKLDRYELIGEIDSGGMASVFLARLAGVAGFQRFVAIKRLHPHLSGEQEFVDMFLDEARLAAAIHHPNVVPILEVGHSDRGYYLVMEYIEGATLARLFSRSLTSEDGPMPRAVLMRVLLDSLAGLGAAHDLADAHGQPMRLVHRDVSPQNILVGIDGTSRITDFGVARAKSRLANTRSDRLKGKIAYMSPEQATAGNVDHRADLFAMGIILWEVFARRRLFRGETEAASLNKVLHDPVPLLGTVTENVSPTLEAMCARALLRDPAGRFQDAHAMADALEEAAREDGAGGVAASRDVAAFVFASLGEGITDQRDAVRDFLAQIDEPPPAAAPGRSGRVFNVTGNFPLVAIRKPRGNGEATPRSAPASAPSPATGEAYPDGDAPGDASARAPASAATASRTHPASERDPESETLPRVARDSLGIPYPRTDQLAKIAPASVQAMQSKTPSTRSPAITGPRAPAAAHRQRVARPFDPTGSQDDATPSAASQTQNALRPGKARRAPLLLAVVLATAVLGGGLLLWKLSDSASPGTPAAAHDSASPRPPALGEQAGSATSPPEVGRRAGPHGSESPAPAGTGTAAASAATTATPAKLWGRLPGQGAKGKPTATPDWPIAPTRPLNPEPPPERTSPAPEAPSSSPARPAPPATAAPAPPDDLANPYR